MRPERDGGIVEILDRLLNKGAIINADVIITVAGIPLLGLTLKAALAGMETMLDYGMMKAWDESTRRWYSRELAQRESMLLAEGETMLHRVHGSLYWGGTFEVWKPGHWYVTDRRVFLRAYDGIAFEMSLGAIDAIEVESDDSGRETLFLYSRTKRSMVRIKDTQGFFATLEKAISTYNKENIPPIVQA
jgi:hypothetical protein